MSSKRYKKLPEKTKELSPNLIDKLIPALGMMALLWALISLSHLPVFEVNTALKELEPTHIDEVLGSCPSSILLKLK